MADVENVLEEADRLIHGGRREEYGTALQSFGRIAALWSVVLGREVTADEVALCLIQLKVARALNDVDHARPIKHDTVVDIAGYAGCLGDMEVERGAQRG